MTPADGLLRDLRALLGDGAVLAPDARYETDATEGRGVRGRADAVVLPASTEDVRRTVAWCYEREVPIVPRGGGSGFAGGAVPPDGGVVVGVERLTGVRSFDPLLWRMHVEAGLTTAHVRRLARENGLLFPPDPGAAEQSCIGGNIATNAGGPHAFKYGVTGNWVTGLEAVVAPGEVIHVGGAVRKDVAGYDLKSLLIGSEGTLGIITSAWLRLIPAPEAVLPVFAFYPDTAAGCAAIEQVLGSGLVPAALEYLDGGALGAARSALPDGAAFMVIAEADGTAAGARELRAQLREALAPRALTVEVPETPQDSEALWRWRDGVSIAVTARHGGKVSEDIAVPLDHLREAIEETVAIGRRHGLDACSWGHAGDGNLHSTMMVARDDAAGLDRARAASGDLMELAARLGGTVSGEHGLGLVRSGELQRQWDPPALRMHAAIKQALDPANLFNPGKKLGVRNVQDPGRLTGQA